MKRLTFANVLSTVAVVLVLAGGTAYAANQLAKNSVGTKQLKKNSVTAKKIKKNAVTKAKVKAGAIDSSKIADGAVTGGDINVASTPFGRVVARPESTQAVDLETALGYQIGSYTKNAGEANLLIPSFDVTFAASCEAPRVAQIYFLIDAANPMAPKTENLAGVGVLVDEGAGQVTRRVEIGALPIPGAPPLAFSGGTSGTHTFSAFNIGSGCSSGGGITLNSGRVEVVGVH
jgi:hypothetical protein